MKQRDHLAVASSSLSFTASESDPEDSFWRHFTFDFSFLTSDDQKSALGDDIDSNALPKESELYGLAIVEEPVLGVTTNTPDSIAKAKGKEACLWIKECSNGSETEVDSPCWRGASTTASNLRRSRDDLNVLYGLNPMAPQFIPSNAKMKNGKEFGENGSPSLKRSLSSTFPPASGEFSVNDLYEHGSDQKNSIGVVVDESLGLVCQDSVSEAMAVLGISREFQRPTKLDPLAPVFVPTYDKSGVADRMIASEVAHIGSNPYTNDVYESGKTYTSNPRLGSQVRISELDSSSNKTHGLKKKLNPLAPQFSLADTKPKVYGSVESQAANDLPTNVNRSVLFSPVGYRNHKELYAQPSVHIKQMGCHSPHILHGNPSPHMDVKKLLTTINGLSELLTHVHGSPDEQDLDLINSTVQNLNSYINNRVQEHTGNYDGLTSLPNMCKSIREHQIPKARNLGSTVDFRRKEKYPMVKGETRAEPQVEYVVTKENGFGQVVRSHETEEEINPQVLFYKSLWLKARADRSFMEYETFLSGSRS